MSMQLMMERRPRERGCGRRTARAAGTHLLVAAAVLLSLPPCVEAQVVPKPTNPTIPVTPGEKSGNSGVDALAAAKKRALMIEEFRVVGPECTHVSRTNTLLQGRVRRQPGGDPFRPLRVVGMDASGRTHEAGVRIRLIGDIEEFTVIDGSLTSDILPVQYTLTLVPAQGKYSPTARVRMKWRWMPSATLVGNPADMHLTRLSSGRVKVRLPEIRFDQLTRPLVIRVYRTGKSNFAENRSPPTSYRPKQFEGGFAAREWYEAELNVPADWGSGDPASWSGEVMVVAYGEESECTGGRQPIGSLLIPFTGSTPEVSVPTTPALAGQWYRLACTSTPAYGPILDDTIRACNANTLIVGFQIRCDQRAHALNGPYSNAYTSAYSGYSVDPDHAACNPIPENWSLISSNPRGR